MGMHEDQLIVDKPLPFERTSFSKLNEMTRFIFFPEIRIWYYMQAVSSGDNLHEMSKPVFCEKKK